MSLFTSVLDIGYANIKIPRGVVSPIPPSERTLRERKKPASATGGTRPMMVPQAEPKKLPKVILKLGPRPVDSD